MYNKTLFGRFMHHNEREKRAATEEETEWFIQINMIL